MTSYESYDNRRHSRKKLACPVTFFSASECLGATRVSGDVSDGGMFVAVPAGRAPHVDSEVRVAFSIPRRSGRISCFSSAATVMRTAEPGGRAIVGVGLKFDRSLSLALDI
ncbi:MAG: PilZ domain-containing protein [Phycisphaerae bacterium]|nr:PilZ domain-containing protein [Phycisphaerae bacterium]